MMGTDMLYFAVARDGLDGGAQITASHNPEANTTASRWCGARPFRSRGEAGIGEIRDMIAAGTLPAPRRRRRARSTTTDVVDDYVEHVMSFIDPSIIKPFNVVLDAGSGMAGLVAPRLFDRLPCKTTRLCFEVDGTFPNHEANPLIEENRRDIIERVDRREGRHRHRLGRRRRSLLLHRRQRRVHRRRLRHGAARRGVPAQVTRARRSSTTCAPATRSRTSSRSTAARR